MGAYLLQRNQLAEEVKQMEAREAPQMNNEQMADLMEEHNDLLVLLAELELEKSGLQASNQSLQLEVAQFKTVVQQLQLQLSQQS